MKNLICIVCLALIGNFAQAAQTIYTLKCANQGVKMDALNHFVIHGCLPDKFRECVIPFAHLVENVIIKGQVDGIECGIKNCYGELSYDQDEIFLDAKIDIDNDDNIDRSERFNVGKLSAIENEVKFKYPVNFEYVLDYYSIYERVFGGLEDKQSVSMSIDLTNP
ncbi:MAG: hypothetical protein A2381_11380 [Bdellovibrionales bacterium RIFOXYB1_FULL_37_110]|nr:MAG: hypothetical protein A2417_11685 [Bdellovibrionales bacterium RIFOXYC1_FULL_37_79]OFZ57294.1 MAG: hypothetical protein A2381_11380 [Bdellovibrionales bacterium RIFOXYB1_FULL_37_110]OFZ62190.1 MAG: hypothetical protein A2577_13930 [Bdellovibrionales bacterium RIFOXYD1_FULL_36_51]